MEDFHQELMENGYSRQEELNFWDCDRTQQVRVAALLSKMAVFAGYDYDARGLTHEYLLERREVFLLSRVALRIHRRPRAGDVLTISTWENGTRGPNLQRVFEMADRAGGLCVSARSDWVLVDPVTRKIMRPGAFTAKPIYTCPKSIDCPETQRVRMPREGAEPLGERRVVWSDLDGNGHLFSGNYGDIFWDYLPPDLQERSPREFFLDYNREATLGEKLHLEGFREGDTYRMEGIGPRGSCFTAQCLFAPEEP